MTEEKKNKLREDAKRFGKMACKLMAECIRSYEFHELIMAAIAIKMAQENKNNQVCTYEPKKRITGIIGKWDIYPEHEGSMKQIMDAYAEWRG